MIFIDEVTVQVRAGSGGKGCESYFRRTDRKMVPNGGDGGKGGDVIVRADRNVTSLYPFILNKHYQAESGHQGSSNQKKGRDGKNLILRVPCGTTVFNKPENLLIRDLVSDEEEVVVLKGGRGGTGNAHYGREATEGERGGNLDITLSVRLSADIVFVGAPNSGKSSLLRYLTHSKVKAESYPFSTQAPHLGIYETTDFKTMTLCELPALIPGSSKGKGLGNHFLKHLERARLVFLMLEPLKDGFDPEMDYNNLREEIAAFNTEYANIPHVVVIAKEDDPMVEEFFRNHKAEFPVPCFFISTQSGKGVDALMREALRRLNRDS